MTALKIIGVILLIFLLIGLLRVGAIVSFGDQLSVQLRVGLLKLTLLPRRKPGKEKKKKEKKAKKPKQEAAEEEGRPKKGGHRLPKFTFDEILDLAETTLSALGRMLRRVCRRTRIDPLDVRADIGGEDPAAVAKTFGYADAAVFAVMPRAEELFYIPNPSIRLEMDFSSESIAAEGTVGVSLRVCDLFAIAFTLIVPLAKWFLRFLKRHRGERKAAKRGGQAPVPAEEETEEDPRNEERIA